MENTQKKDWIKNAIIIFLVIMLLLTLFSNTITNYSLPQVSVGTVYNGSITSSIRGSGTISAGDAYTVKATESRKIASVEKAKGEHVDKGDVIFNLEDAESAELLKAESELSDLELKYYTDLLTSGMDTSEAIKVNQSGASSFESYIARVQNIEKEIENAENDIVLKQQIVDNYALATQVQTANGNRSDNAANYEKEVANLALTDSKNAFDNTVAKTKVILNNELEELNAQKNALSSDNAKTYLSRAYTAISNIESGSACDNPNPVKETSLYQELKQAFWEVDYPQVKDNPDYQFLIEEVKTAFTGYEASLGSTEKLDNVNKRIAEVNNELREVSAMNYVDADSYKQALERYNSAYLASISTAAKNKEVLADYASANKYAEEDLAKAKQALADLKQERTDLQNTITKALEASKYADDIAAKKESIEKLRANAYGATITAPVSGTIQSISKVAGESTEADKEICVIIPDGKAMSVKISVTNEQAKKLKIGDLAELSSNISWNYPDAICTLISIADDTDKPGSGSIATFTVEGSNFKVGQNISLVMASETKEYPMIVPKSSIKSDNSGEYVYKLTNRSSALGTRYYANKIGVKILSQDDTNVAISVTSGDLSTYDNVITGSNKLVEAGKLVRLSESSSN